MRLNKELQAHCGRDQAKWRQAAGMSVCKAQDGVFGSWGSILVLIGTIFNASHLGPGVYVCPNLEQQVQGAKPPSSDTLHGKGHTGWWRFVDGLISHSHFWRASSLFVRSLSVSNSLIWQLFLLTHSLVAYY